MSFDGAMRNFEEARKTFLKTLDDRRVPSLHRYHAVVKLEQIAEQETEILLEQIGIKTLTIQLREKGR